MLSFLALVSPLVAIVPVLGLVTSRQSTANYWFSFGDSYTTTGFNPNGTLPAPGNPLGNPPYPGYTGGGGTNWVDYVTTEYNKSLVLTYNYAYGGATINATLVAPYQPTVLSLIDQVNEFMDGAGKKPAETPWTSENSLFSIWIGINDIGNSWWLPGEEEFEDVLLDGEFGQVQKLYDAGARNFLFVSVPPVNRSPLMITSNDQASRDTEGKLIELFNAKLQDKVASFASANDGVTTYWYDAWTQFTTILDDPTDYGFTNDTTAYGSNDPTMFWGNDYHPSPYAHELFAETVGNDVLGSTVW